MNKVLIVGEDNDYRTKLKESLIGMDFKVNMANNPISALELVAKNIYVGIISKLNLPVMNGLDLLTSIKNIRSQTICILVSDERNDYAELKSIEKNIELFYLIDTSPIVITKNLNRLVSLFRRESETIKKKYISQKYNIVLDINNHIVTMDSHIIKLTPKEFELLRQFLANKNNVLSREYIIDHVWNGIADEKSLRLVDSHIKRLRDKLPCHSIKTVRGYGYIWKE